MRSTEIFQRSFFAGSMPWHDATCNIASMFAYYTVYTHVNVHISVQKQCIYESQTEWRRQQFRNNFAKS